MQPLLPSLAPLDDQALLAELPRLARSERAATVALVARLAELDARGLYLAAGFSSLFAYCTGVLKLSEDQAYYRISKCWRSLSRQDKQIAIVQLNALEAQADALGKDGRPVGADIRALRGMIEVALAAT